MDWKLFFSTFTLIFVAELPDKTAIATILLATRKRPGPVFVGVAMAFLIQCGVAVAFGSVLSLLPHSTVQIGAGFLFLLFALIMWFQKEEGHIDKEDERGGIQTQKDKFWPTAYSSFIVIFIAEWGDLTQLATATLAAKHKSPLTIFFSSVLALWAVTALAILVGNRAKKVINPAFLKRAASIAFAGVGIFLLYRALHS